MRQPSREHASATGVVSRSVTFVVSLAALGMPTLAGATDGTTPRTPAFFGDVPCRELVDRSMVSAFPLRVAIPYEDDIRTVDELEDSRTFQFVAFCRDTLPYERLPSWITTADAERAFAAGAITQMPSPDEVLETSSWTAELGHDGVAGSCARVINDADARMPITCAATGAGLEWDVRDVPVGAYVIRAYTFQPPVNLWSTRRGIVQIVDGPDHTGLGAALMNPAIETRTSVQNGYDASGCAYGPPGATVEVAWAKGSAPDLSAAEAWSRVTTLTLPADGNLAFHFLPPDAAASQAVYLRADVTAPSGQRFSGYTHAPLLVLPRCLPRDPGPGPREPDACGVFDPDERANWSVPQDGPNAGDGADGADGADECPESDTSGDDTRGDASTSEDTGEDSRGEAGTEGGTESGIVPPLADVGCACRTSPRHSTQGLVFVLLVAAARRRRLRLQAVSSTLVVGA